MLLQQQADDVGFSGDLKNNVLYDDYFNKVWFEKLDGVIFLHQTLRTEWCLSTYKRGLLRIAAVKSFLKGCGQKIMYVRVDPKNEKFEEMLGFTPYAREDGLVYMFQEV